MKKVRVVKYPPKKGNLPRSKVRRVIKEVISNRLKEK